MRLLLQIHDELVYEVKEEVAGEFLEIMQNTMISSLNLRVPLTLSVYVSFLIFINKMFGLNYDDIN